MYYPLFVAFVNNFTKYLKMYTISNRYLPIATIPKIPTRQKRTGKHINDPQKIHFLLVYTSNKFYKVSTF